MPKRSDLRLRVTRYGAATLCVFLAGCADSTVTQVVLTVQIDETLMERADSLRVRVGDGGRTTFDSTFELARWGEMPPTVPITNAGPGDTRYLAELTLLSVGEPVAFARALGGFQDGALIERTVIFDAACEGAELLCTGDETCIAGACESACDGECEGCVPPDVSFARADQATVDAGGSTTCAIGEGVLYCWGANEFGQAGQPSGPVVPRPARVGEFEDFVAVSVGTYHTCALRRGGELICFGRNDRGQLGYGDNDAHCCDEPVDGRYVAVSSGGEHTCALTADDELFCWGDSRLIGRELERDLGCEDASAPCEPAQVAGAWTQVAAGHRFTCVLDTTAPSNGAIHCFGRGDERILGNQSTENERLPRATEDNPPTSYLAAGPYAACLIRPSSDSMEFLECWGSGRVGKHGCNLPNDLIANPCQVQSRGVMLSVAVGGVISDQGEPGVDGAFQCAVREDGVVLCVGPNAFGQAGSGPDPRLPVDGAIEPNDELGRMQMVTAGTTHVCGVGEDGTIRCWGNGESGQLGRGVLGTRNGPNAVCLGLR